MACRTCGDLSLSQKDGMTILSWMMSSMSSASCNLSCVLVPVCVSRNPTMPMVATIVVDPAAYVDMMEPL